MPSALALCVCHLDLHSIAFACSVKSGLPSGLPRLSCWLLRPYRFGGLLEDLPELLTDRHGAVRHAVEPPRQADLLARVLEREPAFLRRMEAAPEDPGPDRFDVQRCRHRAAADHGRELEQHAHAPLRVRRWSAQTDV